MGASTRLWVQGETCMYFANTILGKFIFAVQIATALVKRTNFGITSINYFSHYKFHKKFIRVEINPMQLSLRVRV
jgi:hypothetical protein